MDSLMAWANVHPIAAGVIAISLLGAIIDRDSGWLLFAIIVLWFT